MEKENKKSGLKIFLAIIIAVIIFFGGIFAGTLLPNQKENTKIENEEPTTIKDGFNFKVTDPVQTLQDVVNQNENKVGEYNVEYKYTTSQNVEKTYNVKFDWDNKYLERPKLSILINGKTFEHQCKDICYDSITFEIKSDREYIIAYEKSIYMPTGVITVYNFNGEKIKEFKNIFEGYYICDGGNIDANKKIVDIKTDFHPYSKYDNFFMVENINMESVDPNWFETKGSIIAINWETLETEKISEINACFSQQ